MFGLRFGRTPVVVRRAGGYSRSQTACYPLPVQIASYILLTFTAAAILELVFRAPRGSLWLRLTPALVGLSACGIFQVVIFQFVGRERVPSGYFREHPGAIGWAVVFPAACLTVAMAVFLRQALAKASPGTPDRRAALGWSCVIWTLTAAFLTVQFVTGHSSPAP